MPVTILIQTIFALASVGFAALSGKSWYEASEVKMPVKKEIPDDLPDKGRIILGYEDYMVTFAKITEAQERLDVSLEALNQSAALNRLGALYAIGAVTCSALSTVFPLALQSLGVH